MKNTCEQSSIKILSVIVTVIMVSQLIFPLISLANSQNTEKYTGLTYDGADDFVSAPLNIGPKQFPNLTIEFWVKPTRVNYSERQQVISQDDGGYDRSVLIEAGSSNWAVFTGEGVWEPTQVDVNKWQHIAVVYTPNDIFFYKNGVKFNFGKAPSNGEGHTSVNFGRSPGYGQYFKGQITDMRTWNYARTQAEVQSGMNKELTGKEKGLVGYRKFNEKTGKIASESTIEMYHGDLNNGVGWILPSEENGWSWYDPNIDATFGKSDDIITISAPNNNDLWPDLNFDAPRYTKWIKGNFSFITRVKPHYSQFYNAAGIVVEVDDKSDSKREGKQFLRLEVNGGEPWRGSNDSEAVMYNTITAEKEKFILHNAEESYLKLVRIGNRFTGYVREANANAEWKQVGTIELSLPDTLRVGIHVINQHNEGSFSANFSEINVSSVEDDWSAKYSTLKNTSEAGLIVRTGDIDNLGFDWPANCNPFKGCITPPHGYPWEIDSEDPTGTDRIMVPTSYKGNPPNGQDGYTTTTSRPDNKVQPIALNYVNDVKDLKIKAAVLQLFVDDFQSPRWGSNFQVTIDGERAEFLEKKINNLDQTGPIGKMMTVQLPEKFLSLLKDGKVSIRIDDKTTGAGDGFAIDFVRLLLNAKVTATGAAGAEKIKRIDPNKEDPQSKVSDPINTATGAHELERTLLTVIGTIPISFQVNYSSILLNKGTLGLGWNHNFETSLEEQTNKDVIIHWNANRENAFSYKAGTYTGQDQAVQFDALVKNKDGTYTLTKQDQTKYYFNAKGKLTKQENRYGQSLEMTYNDAEQLVMVREPISGQELYFNYNAGKKLENVSDKLGRQVVFAYDDFHNLVGITDPSGNKITYSYDGNGQILTATGPDEKQIFQNTYDSWGRVITQDDGVTGNQLTQFQYDETSQPGKVITTVTDRNGNKKVYTHDSSYHLLSIKDELGNTRSYMYDAKGNRTSATDEKGNTSRYSYDVRGNVVITTDPAGNTATMSYDNRNNLLSAENAQKKKTSYIYDSNNRLLTTVDAANQKTAYTYDKNGLLLSVTSPLKGKTTYSYQNGLLSTVIDSTGVKTQVVYDGVGRGIETTDGKGKSTTTSYDNADNITSVIDPLGNKVTYTYDYRGDKLSESDPNGNTTTYQYNENGKLTTQIDPYGKKTQYTYDGEERLIKVVDINGNASQFSYDVKGQLIQTTDALGNTVKTEYDAVGNVVGTYDALGNKIASTEYDTRNNPTKVTDALGNMTTYTYDALNRNTQVTDALKRQTKYSYDSLNRLVSSTDPTGSISKQGFDADGNRISQTDANGNSLTFTFDKAGRLTVLKNASANITKYAYNSLGQLVQTTNGRGQVTTYTYDDAGRVITMKDPVGAVAYTYDKNGNRTSVKDQVGTLSYAYDQLNRLIKYTDVFGNTIQYGYDAVGNITKLTYPDGKTVQYTYDKANQLTKVIDWKNRATTYTYDKNGQLVKTTRPDGSIETRVYNIAGQLTGLQDVTKNKLVISQYGYTYDKVGNVLQEKTANGAYNMTYSALNQLMIRKDTNGKGSTLNQYQYSYDKTGNILSVKDKQATASMKYGADNRLTKYNTQGMVFDKDGNMTKSMLSGKLQSFTYDARNRLVSAGGLTYGYNANNERISVKQNNTVTRYVVNPQASLSQLLMETTDKGKPIRYHVYGLGLIGTEDEKGQYVSYHYDLRGSTVALTTLDGVISDTFGYGAYGEVKRTKGKNLSPFLYNGRDGVMTDLNGLYYMRARYYNPEIKRFINQDTLLGDITNGQTINRFSYVQGNPIVAVDPSGHFLHIIAGAAIGAVSNAVIGALADGAEGKSKSEILEGVLSSAVSGAITGGVAAATGGTSLLAQGAISVGSGALGNAVGETTKQFLLDEKMDWNEVREKAKIGAFSGGLSMGAGNAVKKYWVDYEDMVFDGGRRYFSVNGHKIDNILIGNRREMMMDELNRRLWSSSFDPLIGKPFEQLGDYYYRLKDKNK